MNNILQKLHYLEPRINRQKSSITKYTAYQLQLTDNYMLAITHLRASCMYVPMASTQTSREQHLTNHMATKTQNKKENKAMVELDKILEVTAFAKRLERLSKGVDSIA